MFYRTYVTRVQSLREHFSDWSETQIGESEEERPIVAFHNAPLSECEVLAWSLMHGNETTGAEAFLKLDSDMDSRWCIVPILNPDGAEQFIRHNAQGVDVNRDARDLKSAEGKALYVLYRKIKPTLALNLHDQRTCFRPEGIDRPATFSLLAPRSSVVGGCANEHAAAGYCGWMVAFLRANYPEYALARFDDTFYPTAFGDLFQETAPTITLETGIALNDWSREGVASALAALLNGLDKALNTYDETSEHLYRSLPLNLDDAVDVIWVGANRSVAYRLTQSLSNGLLTRHIEKVNKPNNAPCWIAMEEDSSQLQSLEHINWEEYVNQL